LLEKKMLRIKSQNSPRISNGLAVLAAVMLMVSALAGINNSALTSMESANRSAKSESAPIQTVVKTAPGGNTHKKNKNFKVSLFLFRIH
jgi:hypothetical protein